jgi:protoporphyrin/coproporphyrin ferrochelatase
MSSPVPTRPAVLLLAHGSPDNIADIPDFLKNISGGRPLPQQVIEEVQHRYSLIGHSPLLEISQAQTASLARELSLPAYLGMRNWKPLVADTVSNMVADGITHAVAICLAPHNSRTSVGLYRRALLSEQGKPLPFSLDFVESWHDHPLLIQAFAERLGSGMELASREAGANVPVTFTAHSVPTRTITEGDPYETQTKQTAASVARAAKLADTDWTFAFQSQGMSGGAWLGPTVEDTIASLQSQGHRGVLLQPIGFLADHVEVLYDIDIAFQNFAREKKMRLWRTESLNDSPTLARALADLARARLKASGHLA